MFPTAAPSLSLADLEAFDPDAKAGGIERRFLCPFPACVNNQDPQIHRCLTVNTQTGAWNCKRCHEKGLLAEWHTRPNDAPGRAFLSPRERDRARLRSLLEIKPRSARMPADQKAAPLPGPLLAGVQPLAGTPGVKYLAGRGLPLCFCHAAGVRFAPDYFGRPAVVFPLRDVAGHLTAMHGRYTDGRTDPKSRTKGPMGQAVFATPNALSGDPWGGRVVVTEAPLDALTLAFCGVPAVAICGTSGGRDLLTYRLKLGQAVATFDADAAGHEAGRALAALLAPVGGLVLRMLPPVGHKDWNAALQTIGPDALRDYLASELSSSGAAYDFAAGSPAETSNVQTEPENPNPSSSDASGGAARMVWRPGWPKPMPEGQSFANLLAFVQQAYRNTGIDIRGAFGWVVCVENERIVGIWNGPMGGRLKDENYFLTVDEPFPVLVAPASSTVPTRRPRPADGEEL